VRHKTEPNVLTGLVWNACEFDWCVQHASTHSHNAHHIKLPVNVEPYIVALDEVVTGSIKK
jgi:hypothetical protein